MSIAKIDNVGGGAKLEDINPNVNDNDTYKYVMYCGIGIKCCAFVQGYSALRARTQGFDATAHYWYVYSDGTMSTETAVSLSQSNYVEISVPQNVVCIGIRGFDQAGYQGYIEFGLIA